MSRPTICLSMIVKNEEKDIKRCLESVIPFIDYWVISDTGSTDNTKKIIQEVMDKHEVPGELHDHDWVDFSTNRNYALDLSREHADFIWCMDADDNFSPNGADPLKSLSTDFSMVHMTYLFEETGTTFNRACMLRSDTGIKFKGVLHEVMVAEDGSAWPSTERALLHDAGHIVARASPLKRNKTLKEKYLSDARILEGALDKDPEDYRAMFYIGQSYQLAEEFKEAIKAYSLRSMFFDKGNKDEVFLSLYEIAKLKSHLRYPMEETIDDCVRAWEFQPTRIESLYLAMVNLYNAGRYPYALCFGMMASKCAAPNIQDSKLELDVYDYKFIDLYSRCMFRCGQKDEAISFLMSNIDRLEKDDGSDRIKLAIKVLRETVSEIEKN
jgi:glycosyltransferase involved in cell wall biosynthesis